MARYLGRQFRQIKTREQLQKEFLIKKIVRKVITETSDGLSYSGVENLKKDAAYLYVSNHRDIILDVAFLNCVIAEIGFATTEIAIGNNLLTNQLVEDLIRINRSFVVKRNLPLREQIEASKTLSKYINHSLGSGNSIWIAQREGRAKDGLDATNPAIIKMIHLSQRRKGIEFSDYINQLNLVPVAISYELDPLDCLKGWELHHCATRGEHKKT